MEIHTLPDGGTILVFPQMETKVALSVLKALYTVTQADFIKEAIEDMEQRLQPRLKLVSHNHLCSKCFMMVDDRSQNCLIITNDGDTTYRHRVCNELKKDRPN